ncbi:family 20 glycosylhydrolase [Actinomyces minihominis]|uniref:family 20 glycosylhydrolase n=1 Tax=Actinomyces minihominis TaxID=2002838 RepID=UPI000C0720A0|nr:family 20 glycosylhydrolase [Actinomyces minihominis]
MKTPNLVPVPVSVDVSEDDPFVLDQSAQVVFSPTEGVAEVAEVAAEVLELATGLRLPVVSEAHADRRITLKIDADFVVEGSDSDEAYRLEVSPTTITLTAGTPRGLNWAIATLRQLVEEGEDGWYVPSVLIEDFPRFEWRGQSLDVARSFFPVDEVKKVVDLLAAYKLNNLHLHLTDDQGWRLEIPGREALTEISGATAGEGGRSGFYTVEEFAELNRYAAVRGVTVVPEFDMPGHTNAANHAYGELTPGGEPLPAYSGMKVGWSMILPQIEATEPFMRDVFTSMAQQTDGPYLHIGGDECYDMNIDDYNVLIRQAEKITRELGRRPVAWQEAAGADIAGDMIYQFWDPRLDREDMAKAVAKGGKLLMSPADRIYFDMKYNKDTPYGQDWCGLVELEKSYNWDPTTQVDGVSESDIIGIEGGMWTEKIHTLDALTYMLLPRLSAVAEIGWSPKEELNYENYTGRLASEGPWWTRLGLHWHRSPDVNWD